VSNICSPSKSRSEPSGSSARRPRHARHSTHRPATSHNSSVLLRPPSLPVHPNFEFLFFLSELLLLLDDLGLLTAPYALQLFLSFTLHLLVLVVQLAVVLLLLDLSLQSRFVVGGVRLWLHQNTRKSHSSFSGCCSLLHANRGSNVPRTQTARSSTPSSNPLQSARLSA